MGNTHCAASPERLVRVGRFTFAIASATQLWACQVGGQYADVPKSVCESGEIWTYTDKDSPLMNPGRSCVQCHKDTNDPEHAPLYTVAGTIMVAQHEADDCRGVAGLSIILTDADGIERKMTGNSAGNFWLDPTLAIALPYTARIVDDKGRERTQQVPVSDGDCASCHTREGAQGASGRLLAPGDSNEQDY
jgi:hypothetical protein